MKDLYSSEYIASYTVVYLQIGGNLFARALDACLRYEPLSLHLFHLLCLPLEDYSKQKKEEEKREGERGDDDFFYVSCFSFSCSCARL
jgi:hypothetical protein